MSSSLLSMVVNLSTVQDVTVISISIRAVRVDVLVALARAASG